MNRPEAAALTASLLARKGEAAPVAAPLRLFAVAQPGDASPPVRPAPSAARPVAERASADGALADRRRITLRLDPARHVRIKLAAAHLKMSLQDVVIAALDAHLARLAPAIEGGGCACLIEGRESA